MSQGTGQSSKGMDDGSKRDVPKDLWATRGVNQGWNYKVALEL